MIVINLDNIGQSFGTQTVLDGASWEIQAGQKIGLVGPNGAGKSTLLRIIASGDQAGQRFRLSPQGSAHRLPGPGAGPGSHQHRLGRGAECGGRAGPRGSRTAPPGGAHGRARGLWRRACAGAGAGAHARAQAEFERLDGYRYESRAREALRTLGLEEADFDLPVGALSGGQKKLVGLAKLLAVGADLLLLDEPDNHLDLAGKAYLERFIAAFPGTVVIVSHDRYLLDGTVTLIAEVEDQRLTVYQGNYSAYAVEKQLRLLRQQQRYEAQQKEIARIEAAIARFELWASIVVDERHARQARSRRKMLERMDKVEKPVLERRRMGLELNGWRGSQKVLEIVDLDKVFAAPSWVTARRRRSSWPG